MLMDCLDMQTVSRLQEDGRLSHTYLAETTVPHPVTATTVRRRILRLLREGYMRMVAVPNNRELGYQRVIFGLDVEPSMIDEATEELAELPEVESVMFTSGTYGVMGSATVKSIDDLGEFLSCQIGPIEGVREVSTFVVLEEWGADHCLKLAAG